jgi:nitroreductase
MDVGDALRARRTVRAFLPRPVPRETLETVLADALRTPSWANTQPWEIFVTGGDVFERIRRVSEERTIAKIASNPDVPFPGAWTAECRARVKELTAGRAEVRGTSTEDASFHHDFLMANRRFFEAPCAIFLALDQTLGSWSMFDLGAMCQSIVLAAQDHGVDSAIAINLVIYPDVLRDELQIPRNLLVVIGISLGYADPAGPEDAFRSVRRPLDDAVTFVGI